jgi:hypothetical protein
MANSLLKFASWAAESTVGWRLRKRRAVLRLPRSRKIMASRMDAIITELVPIFRRYETGWDDELVAHRRRIRKADYSRIPKLVSSFGGNGRIDDIYICADNGQRIREQDEKAVNRKVSRLVRDLERLAIAMERISKDPSAI